MINKVLLGNIITEIRNGIDLDQYDVQFSSKMLPISRIETISNGEVDFSRVKFCEIASSQAAKYILRYGDILFSHINSPEHIGKTAIYCSEHPLVHGINLLLLRVDQQKCIPQYLIYILKTEDIRKYFQARCKKAVNQASLNQSDILDLPIPLPPLDEQQRIAAILQKADRVRRLRRYARSMSESVLQGVFLEMFGDPAKNNKGWDLYEIGEITNVETGGTPSRADNVNFNGNIPWVKTGEVVGNVITDTEEKITEEGLRSSNCEIFPVNSIIVAMYGQGLTRGRTAKLGIPAATNQACAAILPSNKINTDYLWACLKISYERLRDLGRGGNQPNLNLSMIREFLVPIPPLEHQDQFCIIMQKLSRVETQSVESERQAEHLFQSLLKRAFAGQL